MGKKLETFKFRDGDLSGKTSLGRTYGADGFIYERNKKIAKWEIEVPDTSISIPPCDLKNPEKWQKLHREEEKKLKAFRKLEDWDTFKAMVLLRDTTYSNLRGAYTRIYVEDGQFRYEPAVGVQLKGEDFSVGNDIQLLLNKEYTIEKRAWESRCVLLYILKKNLPQRAKERIAVIRSGKTDYYFTSRNDHDTDYRDWELLDTKIFKAEVKK